MSNNPRWVRHISGQGKRWMVESETSARWFVKGDVQTFMDTLHLPKSEYVLCDPPEIWEDVTADCEIEDGVLIHEGYYRFAPSTQWDGKYCLRKVRITTDLVFGSYAFIVERKKS